MGEELLVFCRRIAPKTRESWSWCYNSLQAYKYVFKIAFFLFLFTLLVLRSYYRKQLYERIRFAVTSVLFRSIMSIFIPVIHRLFQTLLSFPVILTHGLNFPSDHRKAGSFRGKAFLELQFRAKRHLTRVQVRLFFLVGIAFSKFFIVQKQVVFVVKVLFCDGLLLLQV